MNYPIYATRVGIAQSVERFARSWRVRGLRFARTVFSGNLHTNHEAHPGSYTMRTGIFRGGKAGGMWRPLPTPF